MLDLKGQHVRKMGAAKMRMLTWMCGPARKDRNRNDVTQEKIGVVPIAEKMTKNRLRWFGHVQRRSQEAPIRRVDCMFFSPGKEEEGD